MFSQKIIQSHIVHKTGQTHLNLKGAGAAPAALSTVGAIVRRTTLRVSPSEKTAAPSICGSLKKPGWGAKWFKMKLKPREIIADYFMGVEDSRIERTSATSAH